MRTTLTVEDGLLDDALRITGERSRSKAVNMALAEWVRLRRLRELRKLRGTIEFQYPIDELRALEVAEAGGVVNDLG